MKLSDIVRDKNKKNLRKDIAAELKVKRSQNNPAKASTLKQMSDGEVDDGYARV